MYIRLVFEKVSWKLYFSEQPKSCTELYTIKVLIREEQYPTYSRKVNYSLAPVSDETRSSNNTTRTWENDNSVKMFHDKNK